ncbi:RlpA-like double-psi beta-barrel-protein domain-containing protein-containing protein [Gautieria morchelliformis]|nr:RlpA-like double-psi beta-barrel-protein domain-containing protein-containing protein [Gautieria morchelliformis]
MTFALALGLTTLPGTFYGTGLGACGITNHDTDHIAAVSEILFDGYPGYNEVNPNSNPVCGKKVNVSYQGKTTSVTITDRCVACGPKDLDFSPAAFDDLADPSIGRISGLSWTWE